eukprot:gnl/Dysnectes_brevis/3621_a4611_1214.p1 GENE.gnl/Dysnectes_brevis/3621_a4611_1214~~gnl/Dysnectes_brevis/3621_a4611_1214.p1  ORF type:complete len:286 (+),score=-6.98 gnl/Dysnectes_brevis/3621_a4611_1214:60-917(+)
MSLPSGWDKHKENLAPLRGGRKVSLMLHTLKPSVKFEHKKRKSIKYFQHKIKHAKPKDDLMQVWLDYLNFLKQTSLSFSNENLEKELEKCVKHYSTKAKYQNCEKFHRICLAYVKRCPNPLDVFDFLKYHKIGQSNHKIIIQHALHLEGDQRIDQAIDLLVTFLLTASSTPVERHLSMMRQRQDNPHDPEVPQPPPLLTREMSIDAPLGGVFGSGFSQEDAVFSVFEETTIEPSPRIQRTLPPRVEKENEIERVMPFGKPVAYFGSFTDPVQGQEDPGSWSVWQE